MNQVTLSKSYTSNLFLRCIILLFFVISTQITAQIIPDFGVRVENYKERLPFRDNKINDLASDGKLVYLGTDKGLFTVENENISLSSKVTGENARYSISTIYIDEQNKIFLGTRIGKVLIQNLAGDFTKINIMKSGAPSAVVNTIHSTDNFIWIGTNKGGIHRFNLTNSEKDKEDSEYPRNINGIYSEGEKLILAGRDNGLFHKTGSGWIQIKNVKKVHKIVKAGDTYWMMGESMRDVPIMLYSTDFLKWNSFTNDLACVAQTNIEYYDFDIDEEGRNIWIATNKGIIQYNFKLSFCNLISRRQLKEFKMTNIDDLAIQNDSTVWVSSAEGELFKVMIYPETYDDDFLEELAVLKGDISPPKIPTPMISLKDPEKPQPEPEPAKNTVPTPQPVKNKKVEKKKSLVKLSDIKCGETLELSQLFFKTNTDGFMNKDNAQDYLDILVQYLKLYPSHSIELYGHTDFLSNNKQYLKTLSQKRVDKVKDFLTKSKIEGTRISTEAFGGEEPIITDRVSSNRSANRRVEVHIKCD